MKEIPMVVCEPLTVDEEIDFIDAISEAVARGDISQADADEMIDRQYDLMAQ